MQKVLYFLSFWVYCTHAQTTVNNSNITTVTTLSPDPCRNGGSCTRDASTRECTSCVCGVGFIGDLCEVALTKINGIILYNNESDASAVDVNKTVLENMIRATLDVNYTVEVDDPLFNNSDIKLPFSFYLERPPQWTSFLDAEVFQPPLQSQFAGQSSTEAVFNPPDGIIFASVTLDVDECISNWTDCSDKSYCVDQDPDFLCICFVGYEGDGTQCFPLTCALSDAPAAPPVASRTFFDANETVIPDPDDILPFGTSILYTCNRYYEFVDANENPIGLQTIACQNGGWGQIEESSCVTAMGFKIAIGMTVVSVIIIVVVIGALVAQKCLQAEKKAKGLPDEGYDQQMSFENLNFDGV